MAQERTRNLTVMKVTISRPAHICNADLHPVYPCEAIKRTLEFVGDRADPGAQPPPGDPTPSNADIR
jgi:hypothetical protein